MRDALGFTYGLIIGVSASFALHSEWFGHHRHALLQVMFGALVVLALHLIDTSGRSA